MVSHCRLFLKRYRPYCSTIVVEITYEDNRRTIERVPRLFSALGDLIKLNSGYLTKFEIYLNHKHVFQFAASALGICLNLTDLIVYAPGYRGDTFERQQWPSHRLRLTCLYIAGMTFSTELLDGLLKFCPDLRMLGLIPNDITNHDELLNMVY